MQRNREGGGERRCSFVRFLSAGGDQQETPVLARVVLGKCSRSTALAAAAVVAAVALARDAHGRACLKQQDANVDTDAGIWAGLARKGVKARLINSMSSLHETFGTVARAMRWHAPRVHRTSVVLRITFMV